jgi:hypothetical protein
VRWKASQVGRSWLSLTRGQASPALVPGLRVPARGGAAAEGKPFVSRALGIREDLRRTRARGIRQRYPAGGHDKGCQRWFSRTPPKRPTTPRFGERAPRLSL